MAALRVAAFIAGVVLVLGTAGSIVRTMVLPRSLASHLSVFVGRRLVYRGVFLRLAGLLHSYEAKDKVLAFGAPMALFALLVVWMLLFFFGYALMIWAVAQEGFALALRESGSSLLTLGFASRQGGGLTALYFLAGFTGLIVVATLIAYLPTLYGSFNRREVLVTMLQSRAGAPAWGPEILARAAIVDLVDELKDLYDEWERWAAEVMETHTTYTVLLFFRSPHPLRSWVLGLLSVLDSGALFLSLAPERAPAEARLCLRMGFTCLRQIADVLRFPYDPDPMPTDPLELTYEEFLGGVHRLQSVGFPMERTPEEAWEHFRGWRVNYETIAYFLADSTVAPPGPWSGPRAHLPGMTIVPERPPNRRPDEPLKDTPKLKRTGWHA